MKKFLMLFLALLMVLSLAACGSKEAATEEAPAAESEAAEAEVKEEDAKTAKTAADVKIVLLLPGEINDQGWNASNYAGVVACNEQLGTSMEYVEVVAEADFESTFREYAERGTSSWPPVPSSMSRPTPSPRAIRTPCS